jgi:cytochrome c peroxidase
VDIRKLAAPVIIILLCSWSMSVVTTPYRFPELNFFPAMPVSPVNPVTVEGVQLGRYLFYEKLLSDDASMSCGSCHKQEYAFSDGPKQYTEGRNRVMMKRNTMPLFNLAWYPSLFWDGRAATIEEQVFHPVRSYNEMNLDWKNAAARLNENKFYRKLFNEAFGTAEIDSVKIAMSIAQFLRTLISNQSKYDRVLAAKDRFTQDEFDGFNLINDQTKGDCMHCHSTDGDALGTQLMFSNNGLDAVTEPSAYRDIGRGAVTGNIKDYGKFMVPTLRNVGLTAPYMHDGRFKTLEEVLDFYSEGVKWSPNIDSKMQHVKRGGVNLTKDEKRKVIAFLHTLTDTVFIKNPEFSKP